MTNSVAIPYLEQAIKISETIYGLPAIPLLCLGLLAVGYLLKAVPFIPNKWIPFGVYLAGISGSLILIPLKGGVDVARAVIFGLIAAVAAIFIHRKWLAKYDKDIDP